MILYAYTNGHLGKYYEIPEGIYHLDTIDHNGTTDKIRLEIYTQERTKAMKKRTYTTFLEERDAITNDIIKSIPEKWVEKED